MSKENKRAWICHSCRSKRPRTDNSNTPVRFTQVSQNLSSSESDNSTLCNNVTQRKKTKDFKQASSTASTLGPETMTIIKGEIQLAVKEAVKTAMESFFSKEFEHIKSELKKLNDLKESVEFLSDEYDRLHSSIKHSEEVIQVLTTDNTELKQSIQSLTTRLHLIEQHSRETNLEINGIPENKSENLYNTMCQLMSIVSYSNTGHRYTVLLEGTQIRQYK